MNRFTQFTTLFLSGCVRGNCPDPKLAEAFRGPLKIVSGNADPGELVPAIAGNRHLCPVAGALRFDVQQESPGCCPPT